MLLEDLGFDSWFRAAAAEVRRPELSPARITRVDRGRYLVRNEEGEMPAEPTGKLLYSAGSQEELPCVGDWVLAQYHNDGTLAIIHHVLPRKTYFRRKSPGRIVDYQMLASNIDTALIVQSCDLNFNIRRLERYLVVSAEGGIDPVILLSKSDLVSAAELEELLGAIAEAGITTLTIPFRNLTQEGSTAVRNALQKGKTFCLLGSSGVGKTSLLNNLLGTELFETQPVREQDDRGRHTTSRRQMTLLESGALLIDTPGLRELGLIAAGESIDESFSDLHELAGSCRFSDCRHLKETGCAVLAAVAAGELDAGRYDSYIKLMKESAFHEMSYAERRKKDRAFGRFINTALKQIRKNKPR